MPIVLMVLVAGCGMWLLAGRQGLSAGGRWVSTLAFMLSGFCLGHTHAPTWLVMLLLPWSLLGLQWLMDRPTLLRLAAVSLLFAAQVFSGQMEASIRLLAACLAFVLLHAARLDRRRALAAVPAALAAGVLGVALAGVQWVPLVAHLGDAGASAPSPRGAGVLAAAWVGTVPILLAIAAIVWRGREPGVLLWGILGAMFALPGAGLIPGADAAGWLVVAALALALLAGAGLDAMLWRLHVPATRTRLEQILTRFAAAGLIASAPAAVIMVGSGLPVSLSLWPILAAAILAGCAAIVRRRGLRPDDEYACGPWLWVDLVAAELLICALPPAATRQDVPLANASAAVDFVRQRRQESAQPFRIAAPAGVLPPDLPGTDDLFSGRLIRPQRWREALGGERYLDHPASRLLNIRYAIVPLDDAHPAPSPPWRPVFPSTQPAAGEVVVFENPQALPRAWIASRPRWYPGLDEVLAALKGGGWDSEDAVLLEDRYAVRAVEPDRRGRPPWWIGARSVSSPNIVIEGHSPRRVALRVSGENAGWLVVADPWMPGWTARVTRSVGPRSFTQDLPVVPAYGLLRAVKIDQSRAAPLHVVLEYRIGGGIHGVFASAGGAIVLVLLAGCGLLPRNGQTPG